MIYKIMFTLIITSSVFAFDKDFTTVNDRVPLEFNYLFDSLKREIKNPAEKLRMVGLCKELDENLGFLQKEHVFFLMKSEVIKNVLEYKFKKVRQFDITLLVLKRLQDGLKKNERFLTPFSQWIWRSILAELTHRRRMGLISNRTFSPTNFEGAKKAEANRFARYLTYLMPWIDRMDSLSAPEFNELTKSVSWIILQRINERSLLFKRYASTATTDTKVTLINIPQKLLELHPEEIKRMQSDQGPATLKEKAQQEKNQARDEMEKLTPSDLSPLSDEISQELEKKVP